MAKSNARFDYYRRRLGLTLKETAALTGHPLETVKGWSRGRRAVPRAILRSFAAEKLRRSLTARLKIAVTALQQIHHAAPFETAGMQAGAALLRLQNSTPGRLSSSSRDVAGSDSSSPKIRAEIQ